jgi:hypothetical protein
MAKQKFVFDPSNEDHVAARDFVFATQAYLASEGIEPEFEATWVQGGSYPMPSSWKGEAPKSAAAKDDYSTLRRAFKAWMKVALDNTADDNLGLQTFYPRSLPSNKEAIQCGTKESKTKGPSFS